MNRKLCLGSDADQKPNSLPSTCIIPGSLLKTNTISIMMLSKSLTQSQ